MTSRTRRLSLRCGHARGGREEIQQYKLDLEEAHAQLRQAQLPRRHDQDEDEENDEKRSSQSLRTPGPKKHAATSCEPALALLPAPWLGIVKQVRAQRLRFNLEQRVSAVSCECAIVSTQTASTSARSARVCTDCWSRHQDWARPGGPLACSKVG